MNLQDHLKSAKKSLFRFEYIQEFDDPEETEFFRKYETTGQVDIRPMMQDWWDFLKTKHQKGVLTQRVRFVKKPLTKYLEWELRIHLQSVEHGDDIRILSEHKLTPRLKELGDFWLIDDTVAFKMNYDSNGRYMGVQEVSPEEYREAKIYLLNHSIPMSHKTSLF